jgi:predicted dehydrogenase
VIGTTGVLQWDWHSHCVQLFSDEQRTWISLFASESLDRNEMYMAELRHYLECIRTGQKPLITGEDGRRVLEIALAAKTAAQQERTVLV